MSLINKMLLDLEARQPSLAPAAVPRPIYQDLHAANSAPPPAPRVRMNLILALFGITAAAISGWVWLPAAAVPPPVLTAIDVPSPVRVESLPEAHRPPELTELPITENPAADPAPAVEADALQLNNEPPLSEPAGTPPLPNLSPPAKAEPVNVEPVTVTVIKTQRVVPATEHAQNAYREGQRQYAERNYPEAERNWRSALDFDSQHRAARAQLATLLLATGRNAEAQVLLEQGVAFVPGYPEFALMLARIQVERGQETAALAMLEQASSRTNGDVDISSFIAALHQRAGRHAEAAQRYQQVLAVRPLEGRGWVGLAISLEAQQNWPAAREAYARALNGTQLTPELTRYAEQRLTALRNPP